MSTRSRFQVISFERAGDGAWAEANTWDTIAALDRNAVGGEGPLVSQRTANALDWRFRQVGTGRVSPNMAVRVDQSLHVSCILFVDPGREEALGLNFAGPRRTVVPVHGNGNVFAILLDVRQIFRFPSGRTRWFRQRSYDGRSRSSRKPATAQREGEVKKIRGGAGAATEEVSIS